MSPEDIVKTIEAAEQAVREKNYDTVITSTQTVLADLNSSTPSKGSYSSTILQRLAKVLRDVGYDHDAAVLDTAESVLEKALKWYPDDIELLIEQGWLDYDKSRFDKALVTFTRVTNTDAVTKDSKILALQGAGATLRMLRRFMEAEETLNEAIKLDSALPSGILLERAWLHFYQQNYDQALVDFQEVLRRTDLAERDKQRALTGQIASLQSEDAKNPHDGQSRGANLLNTWLTGTSAMSKEAALDILSAAASVHSDLNNYPAALLAIDLALKHEPDNPYRHESRIDALKWLRRFDEAEKAYTEAKEQFPDSDSLRNEMGHTCYQQKRYKEALAYFDVEPFEPHVDSDEIRKNKEYANEWAIVVLRKMHRLGEAEKKVDEALVSFGETANLLCEKAVIYFNRHEYDKAVRVFDRALKIDEYNEFAYQWRAASFRQQRKFDEAKKSLDNALQRLPAASGLWEEQAWLHFDQNDLNKADECFAESIRLDPYLLRRQFSRVEVLARLNRNDEALQILLQLREQYPDDLEVAEQLGWFYLRQRQLDHARNQFHYIQTKDPQNALGNNGMGCYFLERREYSAAEDAFRWAIEDVDYEPQYHINLAWSLVRQAKESSETGKSELAAREKLLDNAAASSRNALRLDPWNAKAFSCLGVIAFKRNCILDAEGYFRRSLELNPRDDSHVELGALLVQMGRYEEAKKEFSDAINVNRNDARAHIEMANLLLLTENKHEAVRECRQAVSIDPNNDDAHRALAVALMGAGQHDEAEAVLRRAVNHFGNSGQWQLHLLLSQILIRLGDDNKDHELYNEALKHVAQAKRTISSPNADIYFHAGIVDYKLEDYRSAHRNFKKCLEVNRERFEAERYSNQVKNLIREQRRVLRVNTWAGWGLAIVCLALLVALATFYYRGTTRIVPETEQSAQNDENKQKNAGSQTEKPETGTQADKPTKPKQELIVDKSMLTFMTPLLLGLLVVALLLPNLNKLKLPGGFEAEISELKTKETISTGPKGEIGFGSSVPIISPGPGGR